jgi:transposase
VAKDLGAWRWKQERRRRAWILHQKGWSYALIAEALGVTPGAICQWVMRARGDGPDALQARSRRGQGARLSEAQRALVPSLLARGAPAYGFEGDVWTCRRIAVVLDATFGVRYSPEHVRRLLHGLRWTYQKPVVRASQRDERAVLAWMTERWPRLKKKPTRKGGRPSSWTSRPFT